MSYTVKNISGKVQTAPKTISEKTVFLPQGNWPIGAVDTVEGAVIDTYLGHAAVWQIQGIVVALATLAKGMTKSDSSSGVNTTVLNFKNVSIATVDATTNGAQGSLELCTFPEGLIAFLGATSNLSIARVGTGITTTAAVVAAIGTVVPAVDATLTSTEANILPSTAGTLTAGAGVVAGETTAVAIIDGTAAALKAYLNFAMPDASSTANDALLVNGSVTIMWAQMGDN